MYCIYIYYESNSYLYYFRLFQIQTVFILLCIILNLFFFFKCTYLHLYNLLMYLKFQLPILYYSNLVLFINVLYIEYIYINVYLTFLIAYTACVYLKVQLVNM